MKMCHLLLSLILTLHIGEGYAQHTTASATQWSGFGIKKIQYSAGLSLAGPLHNDRYKLPSECRGAASNPQGQIFKKHRSEMGPIGKGILIGAGAGILLGGIIGYAAYEPCESSSRVFSCGFRPDSRDGSAVLGMGLGLLSGITWGAIIGAIINHQDE